MAHLGVNIDHVATLRQARGEDFPDPVEAALACQKAGAKSIVAHLREDRRHIQDADAAALKKKLRIPLNMEISIDPTVLATAFKVRPAVVTIVPERRQERTTEAGIDVKKMRAELEPIIQKFQMKGIGVSLFIDPDLSQIRAAQDAGADAVEIHTGAYANAPTKDDRDCAFLEVREAVRFANVLRLLTHVGHGLDYQNVGRIAALKGICEFNIGYAIIARALFTGLPRAVADMRRAIR